MFKQNPEYSSSDLNIVRAKLEDFPSILPLFTSTPSCLDPMMNWSLHLSDGSKNENESYPDGHLRREKINYCDNMLLDLA